MGFERLCLIWFFIQTQILKNKFKQEQEIIFTYVEKQQLAYDFFCLFSEQISQIANILYCAGAVESRMCNYRDSIAQILWALYFKLTLSDGPYYSHSINLEYPMF